MPKYTKKWEKEFTKKYSNTLSTLESLEKEYKEMIDSNPDEYIHIYPDTSNIELGDSDSFFIYDYGDQEDAHIDIQLSSKVGSFNFTFKDLKVLIDLRNELMKAIDTFKRQEKPEVVTPDDDTDEDLEGLEETEYEVKAERSLTEAWTMKVMARSGSEALRKAQDDIDTTSNYDSEYYDYGEIEYELM